MVKNNNCGIYCIINNVNQKIYIGSSKKLKERNFYHFWSLKNNHHRNKHLQLSFNKYGIENFEFKILKTCQECDLLKQEQIYINKYNSTNPLCGYNISLKAGKITMTDEIKRKICKSNSERFISNETRKKMSNAKKGKKYALGAIRSCETREKIRKFNKGRIATNKTKEKMSKSGREYQHFVNEWKTLYENNNNMAEIARMYKVAGHTIKRYLKEVLPNV